MFFGLLRSISAPGPHNAPYFSCGLGVSSSKLEPDDTIRPEAVDPDANAGCATDCPHSEANVTGPYHGGHLPPLVIVDIRFARCAIHDHALDP